MLIEYKNVDVYQETQEVLSNVSFTIDEGEMVYIIGKVGSGKSSLLKTMYAELPIHSGEAKVMDYDLCNLKTKHLPDLRKQLGIIFQDFKLLTDRTVESNLRFVLKATGWKNKVEIADRINQVLTLVGMETKGYKLPSELSGGEQQRIAIARAILNHPKLILADEPTGNLDFETGKLITELLRKVVKEQGVTVVMITHNLNLLELFPGRVFKCKDKAFTEVSKEDTKEAEREIEENENAEENKFEKEHEPSNEIAAENADADENNEMEIIEDLVEVSKEDNNEI